MNKKIIGALIAVVVVAAAVFAAGCVGPTEEGKVTLMFGFTPNVGYAPFYAAAANGYYGEEGLNVSYQYSMEGGAGATKQVAADKVEFGYAGDNEVMMGRLQDMPVVAVQRIIQKNLFGIYSKEELGITKPEDLIGKKVALPGPAVTVTTITKIILMQSGINFTQIEPLYVGAAVISTLLAGDADAFGAYLPQKVVAGVVSGGKMNEISASDYTTIGRTYLFTSDTMTNEHSDIVKKFVRATQKGLEYAIEHPEEAVDAYIKYNPEAAEKRDLHLAIWKAMVERGFDRDTNGEPIFHLPSEDNWAEKQDQMFDVGAIDKKTDVSKMFTDEFVKGTFEAA
jgi:NitT/TauT family transport system substrate-binding protein